MVFTALSSFNGVGINTSRTFYKQFFFTFCHVRIFYVFVFYFLFFLFLFISGWDPTVKYLISKE